MKQLFLGRKQILLFKPGSSAPGPTGHANTIFTFSDGTIVRKNISGTLESSIWNGNNFVYDGSDTLLKSDLVSVDIGNIVTSIGYSAFSGCSGLTSITIGENVISIGEQALSFCRGLTSMTIGNGVTSIGDNAFQGCSGLTSIEFKGRTLAQVKEIPNVDGNLQYSWGLDESVIIPGIVEDVVLYTTAANPSTWLESEPEFNANTGAFSGFVGKTDAVKVIIPSKVNSIDVTSIRSSAFRNCSGLTSVTIPNSVTSIDMFAFEGCSGLTSVTIPNSVTSIGSYAFRGCSWLTSVTIPDSVKNIGMNTFSGCSGLTSVTIGNGVTRIYDSAFSGCSELTAVYITDIAKWCEILFEGSGSNPLAYAHNLYLNGSLVTDLTVPTSVTSIGQYAFVGCTNLTSVTIPDSVTSIGEGAFRNCSRLTSVTIPDSVTSIKEYLFFGCNGLTNVIIPDSVTDIGSCAFQNCSGLTSVTIPESVTDIGWWAFSGCTNITSIIIPNNVESIGQQMFKDCHRLTNVTIGSSVMGIWNSAFQNCSKLTSLTIPNSVIYIGAEAFSGCEELMSITFLGKTCEDVLQMENLDWDIPETCIVECSNGKLIYVDGIGWTKINDIDDNLVKLKVQTTSNYNKFGIYSAQRDNTTQPVIIDWGDGKIEGINKNISQLVHEYSSIGEFSVKISNIKTFAASTSDTTWYNTTSQNRYTIKEFVNLNNVITSIDNNAFRGCRGLTNIIISDNIASIGSGAFYSCTGVTSIIIPDSVTNIGNNSFKDCSSLASVTIPDSVMSIGDAAFAGCSGLTSVTLVATGKPGASAENVRSLMEAAGADNVPNWIMPE